MTPEEKLEKVEELLAARDEITAELLALMGAEVEEGEEEADEEEDTPAPQSKKTRKCSGCDKPGHTLRTCGNKAPAVVRTPETHGYSRQPCGECGSIGARHFKTWVSSAPSACCSTSSIPLGDRSRTPL